MSGTLKELWHALVLFLLPLILITQALRLSYNLVFCPFCFHNSCMQHYERGLYNEPRCSSRLNKLDHVVLVVGYGYHYGRPYWLIKNRCKLALV